MKILGVHLVSSGPLDSSSKGKLLHLVPDTTKKLKAPWASLDFGDSSKVPHVGGLLKITISSKPILSQFWTELHNRSELP